MKAITVEPKHAGSTRLEDVAEPDASDGSVLVEAIAVGVCGTDAEIAEGKYGWAPRGKTRLVLGHESLGRVVDPGPNGRLETGDLVVGIVRRPDPLYKAGEALARADHAWLARLVTRRERPEDYARALERTPDDVKVVIQFAEA
jgi:NADPH:quinone reductase-like Zn-dependent oxidoreductase